MTVHVFDDEFYIFCLCTVKHFIPGFINDLNGFVNLLSIFMLLDVVCWWSISAFAPYETLIYV